MRDIILERTDVYRLTSHGNGAAYTFEHIPTGSTKFIQYGDDAATFRDEYENMEFAYDAIDTVWRRQSWDACLAYLYEIA